MWYSIDLIVYDADFNGIYSGIFVGTWYDDRGIGGEALDGVGCVVSRYEDCIELEEK